MKLVIDYPIKYAHLGYGDANFVLAPLLDTSTEYLFNIKKAKYANRPLMFDNGAWEFGKSMDVKRYIDLATEYEPEWIVVPDVLRDPDESFALADEFFTYWIKNGANSHTKVIFAPQGKNFSEMLINYEMVIDPWFPYIEMLGVPKHVGSWMNRVRFTNELYQKCTIKFHNVHFLGLWADEDFTPKREGAWRLDSIDTKAPFKISTGLTKWKDQMSYYHYEDEFNTIGIEHAGNAIKRSMDMINHDH